MTILWDCTEIGIGSADEMDSCDYPDAIEGCAKGGGPRELDFREVGGYGGCAGAMAGRAAWRI